MNAAEVDGKLPLKLTLLEDRMITSIEGNLKSFFYFYCH